MQGQPNQNANTAYEHHNDQHYMVRVNQQYKCVCQLCKCGKHRCPRPKIKGEFETSYNNHYKNNQIVPVQPTQRYQYQDRHYNLDTLKTNYQESYFNLPVEIPQTPIEQDVGSPSRFEKLGKSIVNSRVPFSGSTSYKDQYKPYTVQHVEPNPESNDLSRSKLSLDYGSHPDIKFEGVSAYKSSFQSPQPVKMEKPAMIYSKYEAPFYGSSSYQDSFKGYKMEPIQQHFSSQLQSTPPKVKFEGNSHYKEQYPGYEIKMNDYSVGKGCELDELNIPPLNYLNEGSHIYYDQNQKRFH